MLPAMQTCARAQLQDPSLERRGAPLPTLSLDRVMLVLQGTPPPRHRERLLFVSRNETLGPLLDQRWLGVTSVG